MAKSKSLMDEIAGMPNDNPRQVKADKQQIETLTKMVETLQARLDRKANARFKFNVGRKGKSAKGAFVRVIIPDTHGCWVDKPAIAAVLNDIERINPREIVFAGDHLDCSGWLAQHHPFATVQEAKYSFEDDVEAGNVLMDEAMKRAPNADAHYLFGNHEGRIESWIVKHTGQHPRDAAYVRKMFSCEGVLDLEKRGIKFYKQAERYCGLRIPGLLKLGHCHFLHGFSHGKNAAAATLNKLKCNVVFAHVHRWLASGGADTMNDMAAWCPGCLCVKEPMWRHGDPTEWNHGYAVQFVQPDGDFLHINIPVMDGKSYFIPLSESYRA